MENNLKGSAVTNLAFLFHTINSILLILSSPAPSLTLLPHRDIVRINLMPYLAIASNKSVQNKQKQ